MGVTWDPWMNGTNREVDPDAEVVREVREVHPEETA